MANKCAGHERDADFGIRVIAELPCATVQRIHVFGLAREHADRHAASQNFSVGREVRAYVKKRLAAAGMDTETGNDFIKHKAGFRRLGDFAKLFQERNRLKIWMAALHGLNDHCRKPLGVFPDPLQ